MKTAKRGTPNCRIRVSGNRAHGAGDQNRSCSNRWAAKQEKIQPLELCFFLTSPFRELPWSNWDHRRGDCACGGCCADRPGEENEPGGLQFFRRWRFETRSISRNAE